MLKGREGQGRRKGGTNMTFLHMCICVCICILSLHMKIIYIVYVYMCTYIILQHVYKDHIVVVQSLSRVRLFVNPQTVACQGSLSFTISQTLLKFMSIELVMLSNHLSFAAFFSFCLQSFPVSGSFPMSHLFASGTGASVQHQSFQYFRS